MSRVRTFLQPILVLVVLGAGVGTLAYFRSTKPEAERVERPSEGLLVEVQVVHEGRHDVVVRANGTVIPATRVVMQSEIGGRIVWQSPELVPGGKLKKGALVLRIDPRDYSLQLEARKAEVSRAELELQVEQSRQQVAQREWELFGEGKKEGPTEPDDKDQVLALRGPQRRTAQVAVESAESALNRAKLDLTRTSLSAPFNALVIEERVDVGQLVNPQTQLATLVGTDKYWVQVSVPVESLSHVSIPGVRGAKEGSNVSVFQSVGAERVERAGRIERLLPDLDTGGAMARLLIAIEDPLGLKGDDAPLPILLNSYVNVEIAARPIEKAVEVPRVAIRDNDQVYVVDAEGRLRIREADVVWRSPRSVLVRSGLKDGDSVVVSRVAAPVDGMPVRTSQPTASSTRSPRENGSGVPAATQNVAKSAAESEP